MPERVIIFDVGGVIGDDMHGPLLRELAAERYPSRRDEVATAGNEAWRQFSTDPAYTEERFWAEVIKKGRLTETVTDLKDRLRADRMRVFWQPMAVAERLSKRRYPVGILSNHSKPWFEELSDRFRFDDVFDRRITVVSYEIRVGKPEPEAYQALLKRIANAYPDVPIDKCIFIDNKKGNVNAAWQHGLRTIHFAAKKAPISALVQSLTDLGVDAEGDGTNKTTRP